jgi:leucyl-tRNA synthetase
LGNGYSVYNQKWPEVDESALVKDEIEIAVQINGKVQFKVNIPAEADQAAVEAIVNADDRLAGALAGRSIVKFIYVKGRIANIVAK